MNERMFAPMLLTVPSSGVPKIWSLPGPGPLFRQIGAPPESVGPSPEVLGLTPVSTHAVASEISAGVGIATDAGNTSLRWKPW